MTGPGPPSAGRAPPSAGLLLALLLAAASCAGESENPAAPVGEGSLTLAVTVGGDVAGQGALAVDQYRATIAGPTNRTITAAPGTTATIEALAVGTYTVTVEGLVGGLVDVFDQQPGVQVRAGQNTTVTLTLSAFRPTLQPLPGVTAATELVVEFSAVDGAQSYNVEWDRNAGFGSATRVSTTGTSATISVPGAGFYFVRVQAVDVLGSPGTWTEAAMVQVVDLPETLPVIRGLILDPFVDLLVSSVNPATGLPLRTALEGAIAAIDAADVAAVGAALSEARGLIDASTVPADIEIIAVLALVIDYSLALLP